MSDIEFAGDPFGERLAPDVPFWQVKGIYPQHFLILSELVVGLYTHWTGHDDVPHTTDPCYGCTVTPNMKWQGYLCAQRLERIEKEWIASAVGIVEITAAAKLQIDDLAGRGTILRGFGLTMQRRDKRPSAKVLVKLDDAAEDRVLLPPLNVEDWIRTFYKLERYTKR